MKYNPDIHHRRSTRLREYDYSQIGAYFVTVCTQHRECSLCDVADGVMKLTFRGMIAHQFWFQIPDHFENVQLDEFIVMPNHIHGIIVINGILLMVRAGRPRPYRKNVNKRWERLLLIINIKRPKLLIKLMTQ